MDLTDTGTLVNVLAGLVIALGVIGVIIPVLPGLWLTWLGVVLWAFLGDASTGTTWLVASLATLIAMVGTLVKYLIPGKRMKRMGVPNSALLAGGVLGLIGFFVIPVVGLILGFVLGVYLVEHARLGAARAWPSTREAITAAGVALLIEFAAALGIAVVWVFGLVLTLVN